MKVKVIWDLEDGFDNEVNYLPSIVDVPNDIDDEDIADWLSDNYDFCVESWYLA